MKQNSKPSREGSPLRILVDDRESDEDLLRCLGGREDLCLVTQRLPLGDYLVDGSVLFERKTVTDFSRSLIDGRLFSQAQRMACSSKRPAFILEGTPKEWMETGVRREALQGAFITLMLIFDIPLFRSQSPEESARILVYAGRQLIRLRTGGESWHRQAKAKRKSTRQHRILQSLPGIGAGRASQLLAHFGSVESCIQASVEELESVEGIGPQIAQSIRNAVSEDCIPFGDSDNIPLL